jgi:hypothetical protein
VRKALFLIILFGIILLGCSDNFDDTIITAPPKTDNLTKSTPPSSNTFFSTDSVLHASELIDGEIGGWLIVNETYINSEGRQINVYARLRILPGSYQGTINIEMVFNDEDVSIKLFPEMAFTRDVRLDLWFQGTDLQALGYKSNGRVDFAYFADNGDFELIENNISHVNIHQNKIRVLNAKLQHFSRYGWTR